MEASFSCLSCQMRTCLSRIAVILLLVVRTLAESEEDEEQFSTNCECGSARMGEYRRGHRRTAVNFVSMAELMMQHRRRRKKKEGLDARTRIVDGYEPQRRPFMALLEMSAETVPAPKSNFRNVAKRRKRKRRKKRRRKKSRRRRRRNKSGEDASTVKMGDRGGHPQCGGVLINKRWVITAAHCFCMPPLGCKLEPSRPDFGLTRVTVYLGQHDITHRRSSKENIYKPTRIVVHPKYIRNRKDQNDIALVRLDREVSFTRHVSPICLPSGDRFRDTRRKEVFVAGWGLLSDSKCTTDAGPEMHKRCQFPFNWSDMEHFGCSHTYTPSRAEPECRKLRQRQREMGKYSNNRRDVGFRILDEDEEEVAVCYDSMPGAFGWCATAAPEASSASSEQEPESPSPTSESGWGWCSEFCRAASPNSLSSKRRTSTLQEAQLSTLSSRLCAKYGRSMKAMPRIELCAGLRERQPVLRVMVKTANGSFEERRDLMDKGAKYYLGGRDSCKGDSGGPLFVWEDGRAVLIGIVSRGKGCGGYNEAGIYTRIKRKLGWIFDHVGRDNCEEVGEGGTKGGGGGGIKTLLPREG